MINQSYLISFFKGTYKVVPKVQWLTLLVNDFGHPNWEELYPLNDKGLPTKLLTPRMACKLFHDAVFIIKKGDESPKYMQDRLPEIAHKTFKKKQWRKQFFEATRRVACRLAIGLGFKPNCVAEDVFIHVILGMAFELGWRRIDEYIEPLPVSEKDRDFARVAKLASNEDIASLTGQAAENTGGKKTKAVDANTANPKSWFKCYDLKMNTMFDHIVQVTEEDTDNWSVTTGSTMASSDQNYPASPHRSVRADSITSVGSVGMDDPAHPAVSLDPIVEETPACLRANSSHAKLSATNLATLAEQMADKVTA